MMREMDGAVTPGSTGFRKIDQNIATGVLSNCNNHHLKPILSNKIKQPWSDMNDFISVTWSSVSETLYIYNPLLPRTKNPLIIPPAFDTRQVTARVGRLRRADASSGTRSDPAIVPIDVGADSPVGPTSCDCQILLGARGVLQHLQTVNAINNVNICQNEMVRTFCASTFYWQLVVITQKCNNLLFVLWLNESP